MKKFACIIMILALFGCNKSENVKSVLVNVKASGEIELAPNMADIAVNISCTDKVLGKSNDCTRKGIDSLFALLAEHQISKDDYHSSRIDLNKDYIWRKNSQVFNGYKTSSTVNILFRDLETMSPVISRIMAMTSASLFNLSYSHSELESYGNKTYMKALDNAKVLAGEISGKLGGKSVEVLQVSNIEGGLVGHDSGRLDKMAVANFRAEESPMIQVNPGKLKLVKNIYAQYRIGF
jgi:uncharacterized protein YggE